MSHHRPNIPFLKVQSPSFHYGRTILRHRPSTLLSGALLLFCLLSMVTLSLLFAENTYLTTLVEADTGKHYGVLYRLDSREYEILCHSMEEIEAAFTVVPVYGYLEDIESEKAVLGVTVLTGALRAWYGLDWQGTLTDNHILLPPSLPEREPYYRGMVSRSFFFHGENTYGSRVEGGKETVETISITRELTILDTVDTCDRALPYAFVTATTAEDILSATGGDILYDVYFTTPIASDYAVAQVVDTLLHAIDRDERENDTDKIREGLRQYTGDPVWSGRRQVRYASDTRQIMYMEFIHYELLDLLNREYMDDPMFFLLILPVILASAFAMAGFLRDDTEKHMDEYGLLKASGTGIKTMYGMVYAQSLLMLLLAMPPVLLGTAVIAGLYDNATAVLFREKGVSYAFPMPWGNLLLVCLYVLLLTCFLIWLRHKKLFAHTPASLLGGHMTTDKPEVRIGSALEVLDSPDPVKHMAKVRFRRGLWHRVGQTLPTALVMGVCGYMFFTLLFAGTGGVMDVICIVYLGGAWLLLSVQSAVREVENSRREFAILRQCGTAEETIWHHLCTTRRYETYLCMVVTAGIFLSLFILPVVLGGWVFAGTPMYRFLSAPAYVPGVLISCGISILLQVCDLFLGKLVMVLPMKQMFTGGVMDDLRRMM